MKTLFIVLGTLLGLGIIFWGLKTYGGFFAAAPAPAPSNTVVIKQPPVRTVPLDYITIPAPIILHHDTPPPPPPPPHITPVIVEPNNIPLPRVNNHISNPLR